MKHPSDTYEDIIHRPHHVSRTHRHMTLEERAAQFSPFAALTGYEDAIDQTRRKNEQELEEDPFTRRPFHPRNSDSTS